MVGHGSRRREANDDVRELHTHREACTSPWLSLRFEIEHPNISEGFARLVDQAPKKLWSTHTSFLSRHTRDIPVEVRRGCRHPGISFRISEPLSAHPLVFQHHRTHELFGATTCVAASCNRGDRCRTPSKRSLAPCASWSRTRRPWSVDCRARDLIASCDACLRLLVNPDSAMHADVDALRRQVGGGRQTHRTRLMSNPARVARK